MIKVKVCGITNAGDARAALAAGCDALGFIFAESPRRVSTAQAKAIISSLPAKVCRVGVFVNEEPGEASRIARSCGLSALQLHGEEPPEYARRLRGKFKIIKAFRIKDKQDLARLRGYPADFYLLDTFREGVRGGTGAAFPRHLAAEAGKFGVPVILSGGLNPENVGRAIRAAAPFGVDVSSGVEKSPGKKDVRLVREFVRAVRGEEPGNS